MIDPSVIEAAFASLPSAFEQAYVHEVSVEISKVAANRQEAMILVALAWHETKLARKVLEGHCSQLPKGMRCDSGRALGVWQLHHDACRDAWALATPNGGPEGQLESLPIQARCAVNHLRYNMRRGKDSAKTPIHAAFAGYAARTWDWPGADARVKTVEQLLQYWNRFVVQAQQNVASTSG